MITQSTSTPASGETRGSGQPYVLERNTRPSPAPAERSVSQQVAEGKDSIVKLIEENPTLALAGFAALGAIVALAVVPKREAPSSVTRKLRRDLARHTSELRQTVRQELRDSGLDTRVNNLSNSLASIDWRPYIKPYLDQALSLADDAKTRIQSAVK